MRYAEVKINVCNPKTFKTTKEFHLFPSAADSATLRRFSAWPPKVQNTFLGRDLHMPTSMSKLLAYIEAYMEAWLS